MTLFPPKRQTLLSVIGQTIIYMACAVGLEALRTPIWDDAWDWIPPRLVQGAIFAGFMTACDHWRLTQVNRLPRAQAAAVGFVYLMLVEYLIWTAPTPGGLFRWWGLLLGGLIAAPGAYLIAAGFRRPQAAPDEPLGADDA